jgi:hypothetical protein
MEPQNDHQGVVWSGARALDQAMSWLRVVVSVVVWCRAGVKSRWSVKSVRRLRATWAATSAICRAPRTGRSAFDGADAAVDAVGDEGGRFVVPFGVDAVEGVFQAGGCGVVVFGGDEQVAVVVGDGLCPGAGVVEGVAAGGGWQGFVSPSPPPSPKKRGYPRRPHRPPPRPLHPANTRPRPHRHQPPPRPRHHHQPPPTRMAGQPHRHPPELTTHSVNHPLFISALWSADAH